jgi:hypothetical protein
MKYIIEMPDGWKPENEKFKPGGPFMCQTCPFSDAKHEDGDDFCEPGGCPLSTAVEVKDKPGLVDELNEAMSRHTKEGCFLSEDIKEILSRYSTEQGKEAKK